MGVSLQVNNSDFVRISWGDITIGNMTNKSVGVNAGPLNHKYGHTSEHSIGEAGCACGLFSSPFDEKMECPANVSTGNRSSYDISVGGGLYLGIGAEASISFSPSALLDAWGDTLNYVWYSDSVF